MPQFAIFFRAQPTNVGRALCSANECWQSSMLRQQCWQSLIVFGLSVRLSVRLSMVTLTQSFLIGFLPNIIWIASINLSFKFEYGFCPITKMAIIMAATYQFPCRGHSNSIIFNQISSKFYELLPSTLRSFPNKT